MKDWTIEEACAAHEAHVAAGGAEGDPAGPYSQWAALRLINAWQAAYEAGDTFVVMQAVAECARCELVMPEWVVRAFLERIRSVTQYKVKSLDEAFGSFLPKGAHLTAHRQAWENGFPAFQEVRRRNKAGEAIDQALFESIGEKMAIGGSKVRDYYYHWMQRLDYKKIPE